MFVLKTLRNNKVKNKKHKQIKNQPAVHKRSQGY